MYQSDNEDKTTRTCQDIFHEELEKLLAISYNRTNSNRNWIFERFDRKACKSSNSEVKVDEIQFCSKLRSITRIHVVKRYFEWAPLSPLIRKKYQKNNRISTALSKLGNKAQVENNYAEAVKWYNLALLFAFPGSTEFGIAFANRSFSLHALGLKEEALRDLDLALKNGYPTGTKSRKRMHHRRNELMKDLGKGLSDITDSTDADLGVGIDIDLEQKETEDNKKLMMKEFCTKMFSLKNPNYSNSAMEDCVDLKYSMRSTHLLANRDIPIGTTVLVQKPSVAVLLKTLSWDVEHCHHCFRPNIHCIPCPTCVFVQYCDEKCQTDAQHYHKYECPCLPDLHCNLGGNTSSESNFLLAFRLVCLLGPQKLYEMYTKQRDETRAEQKTVLYDKISYRSIQYLNSMLDPNEIPYNILTSVILSRTLGLNSNFFDSLTNNFIEKDYFRDFVTQLILHRYEASQRIQATFSKQNISARNNSDKWGSYLLVAEAQLDNALNYDIEKLAYGINLDRTASGIRHSCNPNLMRIVGNPFGTTAYITIRTLKEGEELCISYGPQYTIHNQNENADDKEIQEQSTKIRRRVLNQCFGFVCSCIACTNDWPAINLQVLQQALPSFCCSRCASSASFPHDSKMSPEFVDKCKLTGDFRCKTCGMEHDKEYLKLEYTRHFEFLRQCRSKLMDEGEVLETINDLKKAIIFFENNVCPPMNLGLLVGPSLYKDAINRLVYLIDYNSLNAPTRAKLEMD